MTEVYVESTFDHDLVRMGYEVGRITEQMNLSVYAGQEDRGNITDFLYLRASDADLAVIKLVTGWEFLDEEGLDARVRQRRTEMLRSRADTERMWKKQPLRFRFKLFVLGLWVPIWRKFTGKSYTL